jgi:hypothetical protein
MKSSILIPLLRQLIDTLQRLSSTDTNLDRLVNRMQLFLDNPYHANGTELRQVLDQLREILISYGFKHNQELPQMMFVIYEELDDLLHQAQILQHSGQSTAGTDVVASKGNKQW